MLSLYDITAFRWSDGTPAVLGTTTDSEGQLGPLFLNRHVDGAWQPWRSLGSPAGLGVYPAARAILDGNGCAMVAVVGEDNAVWVIGQESKGSEEWTGWTWLGRPGGPADPVLDLSSPGYLAEVAPPALALNSDGRAEVFAIDEVGSVWHRWQTTSGGPWSPWDPLDAPAEFTRGPISVVRGPGPDAPLQLFTPRSDGLIYTRKQRRHSGWDPWTALPSGSGVATYVAPLVAVNADGRCEVFVIVNAGDVDQIAHCWETTPGGKWSGWSAWTNPYPGGFQVAAVDRRPQGQLAVLAITNLGDNDVSLWERNQTSAGKGWDRWFPLAHFTPPEAPGGLVRISTAVDETGALAVLRAGGGFGLLDLRSWAPYEWLSHWAELPQPTRVEIIRPM
jgi:hypothetical protein